MFSRARARTCARVRGKCAPRALRIEFLEIRNYLSASPSDVFATPQVSIIPSINTAVTGYTPAQIASAYGFNQIKFGNVVGNGAGQTIAIVDAYDDASIATNLATFDQQFGLPSATLTKVNETGGTKMPVASQSWDMEISLDVEWTHAMAPGANILLVEANSSSLTDLLTAVNYARSQPSVSVVSMSWGAGEFSGEQSYDTYFTTPAGHGGETFVASSGDGGAGANWPAVSPNVVAVGGTTLSISGSGAYSSEIAWSGSGGGASTIYSTPSYQVGVQTTGHRTVPDVSFDANPVTGFAVYDTAGGSAGWMDVGGTSAGAPQWSALIAIANQGRALSNQGALNGTDTNLYKLPASDFHDITLGSNGQYSAKAGYDEVTGRGSPIANLVARDLVGVSFPTAPTVPPMLPRPIVISSQPAASGSAGAHLELGSGDFGSTSTLLPTEIESSISAGPSTIVGATSAVTNTTSFASSPYQTVTGFGIRPAAGTAGIVESVESQSESTTSTEDETSPSVENATVDAPAATDVDAVLAVEYVDSLQFLLPEVGAEADAAPAAGDSAVDACFAEGDFADFESSEADAMPAESASEHPATMGLAVLAGLVVGGWRPLATVDRSAGLVNRGSASRSTANSKGDDEGSDE